MRRKSVKQFDRRVTKIVARLDKLVGATSDRDRPSEIFAAVETLAAESGGEKLFELPARHPTLGECKWAVLRFQQEQDQRLIHVFLGGAKGNHWVGEEKGAPDELASFAHAWTDVLIGCLASLGSVRTSLAASR
ncbi:MAG: hypothetical protein KDJ46_12810 [Rhodobiaceae bacterium]|nr:hypothetical protein [Rhodobiaceae bacterium]